MLTDESGQPVVGPDGQPVIEHVRDLPASERFFAGGDTTVRGFQLDRVGRPDTFDSDGTPKGGHAELILNGELRVALWKDLGVVGFIDAGNVFSIVNDVSLADLRTGAGFGIRYKSPVGPIRIDIGFKLGTLQTFGTDARRPLRAAHQHRAGVLGKEPEVRKPEAEKTEARRARRQKPGRGKTADRRRHTRR